MCQHRAFDSGAKRILVILLLFLFANRNVDMILHIFQLTEKKNDFLLFEKKMSTRV